MKKRMVLVAVLVFVNCAVAVAEEKTSPAIVAVSRQEVVMNSETGKIIQLKLQKKQEELGKPFNEQVKIVQERESKLIAAQGKPNADTTALEFEKRELMLEGQKLQAQAQKIEGMMGELYNEYMKEFEVAYKNALKDLAAKNNWIMILPAENTDYVSPSVLVTDQVIKALDEHTKKQNQNRAKEIQAKAKNNDAKNHAASA